MRRQPVISDFARGLRRFAAIGVLAGPACVFGQAAGEPRAGGRPEENIRYMLPPSQEAAAPQWTAAEQARGYVVFSDSYLNSFWPQQTPTRPQIAATPACRLARAEYEPIQLGVYGVANELPLTQVAVAVDLDLRHEIRRLEFRERSPSAPDLKHLGAVEVPYVLKLGSVIETVAPEHAGTFWIVVQAPADARAGKHTGAVRVTVQGKPAIEIPLTVEILPFTLPKPDIAVGMYHYDTNTWVRNHHDECEKDQAAHGMNGATLYAMPPGIKIVRDEVTPAGRIEFSDAIVEEMASRIANGVADPNVPLFLADYDLVNWHSGSVADKLSLDEKKHVARLYNTWSATHGWPRIAAQMHDEPTVAQPESFFTWSEGWKRSDILTATAMSGKAATAFGYLHDIWIVHTGQISPEMVREAERQNAQVWTYTFSMGAYNALSNRYMAGLYTWALRLRGNYQWSYYHGDHFVVGDGDDAAPLVSWEGRREGVDDYRYLMALEALLAETHPGYPVAVEARAWLDELRAGVDLVFFHGFGGGSRVDGPFCYPAPDLDIEDYDRIRARAADYCLKLGLAGRRGVRPLQPLPSRAPKWEAAPYENESVDVCIAALSAPAAHRRRSAAAALAMRGEEGAGATDRLIELLADPEVRIVAMRALNAIGRKADRAAAALGTCMDDADEFVRMSAALALGTLGETAVPQLRKALYDDVPQVGAIACEALARLGELAAPAVPDLIEMLGHPHAGHGAVLALQGIGPAAAPAVAGLVVAFEKSNGRDNYVAKALGNIGPAAAPAIPVLERHRDFKYWSTGINAALFKIRGDKADLEMLALLLTEGQDRYCLEYAARALEDLGVRGAPIAPAVARLMKEKADLFASYKGPSAQLANFLEACNAAGVSLETEATSEQAPAGNTSVLFAETFDRPGIQDAQSIVDTPLQDWKVRKGTVRVSNRTAFGNDTFALWGKGHPHWGGTVTRAIPAPSAEASRLTLTFRAFVAEQYKAGEETMITVNDCVGFFTDKGDGPYWSYNSGAGGWFFDGRAAGSKLQWKLGKVGTNQVVTCTIVWDKAAKRTWGTLAYRDNDTVTIRTSPRIPIATDRLDAIQGVVYYNCGYNNGPNYGIDVDDVTVTETR